MPPIPAIDHAIITLTRRVEVCRLMVEPNRVLGPIEDRPWVFVFSVVVDGHQFIESFAPLGGYRPEATEVWEACIRKLQRNASVSGPDFARE